MLRTAPNFSNSTNTVPAHWKENTSHHSPAAASLLWGSPASQLPGHCVYIYIYIHFVLRLYEITDVLCVFLCTCTGVCMWDSQICWLSSISSISVGMYPIVLMHSPRSLQLMKPSLSLSNSLKASRSSVRKKHNDRFRNIETLLF